MGSTLVNDIVAFTVYVPGANVPILKLAPTGIVAGSRHAMSTCCCTVNVLPLRLIVVDVMWGLPFTTCSTWTITPSAVVGIAGVMVMLA